MHFKKISFLVLILFITNLSSFAQRAEIGIVTGGAGYIGDLNQNDLLKVSGVTAGVFAKINFTPFFGLGMHYNYANISADDLKSNNQQFRERGLNFNTNLNELSLIADVNLFDAFSPISKRRFTPYIFAGIGAVYFKTSAEYANYSSNDLRKEKTEGQIEPYQPFAFTIPFGAGVKYKLTKYLSFSSQIGYRTALTDYIDDVSGFYNSTVAPSNPTSVGAIGTQRGDLRKRDTYMFVSIGISYNFVSQKCFTF